MNLNHVTKFYPYFAFTVYCFYTQISSFMPVLSTRIVLDCFYLLIFYSEKFSTDVCRLSYAVNVNLNLSNSKWLQNWNNVQTIIITLVRTACSASDRHNEVTFPSPSGICWAFVILSGVGHSSILPEEVNYYGSWENLIHHANHYRPLRIWRI